MGRVRVCGEGGGGKGAKLPSLVIVSKVEASKSITANMAFKYGT